MKTFFRTAKSMLLGLCLAACTALSVSDALAADKLILKDGKVIEGTIINEVEGYIWIKYSVAGIEQTTMFEPNQITKIDRDSPVSPAAAVGGDAGDKAPAALNGDPIKPGANVRPGTPKAAVITLGETRDDKQGDMVGIFMTAYALDTMMPMLEEEVGSDGTGVVVLRFNSGGGALLEIIKISDAIHQRYKKKFRTVGWIDSAISAAAMSAHTLEELYFTNKANYGACTGFNGGTFKAISGPLLERVLYMMERISAQGGYDPLIMRAMQIQQPLSCTRLPDGTVKWFGDATSGEILVNRETEILTFNAETALQVGFSKGTASTINELTKAMGYNELDWKGDDQEGVLWKVCKAEKWNVAYRKKAKVDQDRTQEYFAAFNMNIAAAASEQTREGRAKFVNGARRALESVKAMVRNNPNFILFALNLEDEEAYKEFVRVQEKRLRDLMK